ncbi:MAG: ribosomal protein S18-alanine N-acetyltransferase [Candidatus Methanomethylicaceae archaeon]|nr:ribosomal protein S18-alanine N-acetyltransferase [Candidatus Verstraetearchaeota archaeon]
MIIRRAEEKDLKEIYRIEVNSFKDPYPYGLLKAFLYHPGVYLVIVEDEKIIGYSIGIIRFKDLGHIISIAIDKDYRGKGFGKKLLKETIDNLIKMGVKKIRIEVRESNEIAINLYKKFGFIEKEKIKEYYPNGESAIVMFLDVVKYLQKLE